MNEELLDWIKSIAVAIVLALIIKNFLFYSTLVRGESMEPTLKNEDRLFSNKIPLYFSGLDYGDVISFKAPNGESKHYVKRVIGLEGDTIEIRDGRVYRNGQELNEDYIAEDSYTDIYNDSSWTVEKDRVFVLGDNRLPYASDDSRSFGTIDIKTVDGITNFRYYPFNKGFGRL